MLFLCSALIHSNPWQADEVFLFDFSFHISHMHHPLNPLHRPVLRLPLSRFSHEFKISCSPYIPPLGYDMALLGLSTHKNMCLTCLVVRTLATSAPPSSSAPSFANSSVFSFSHVTNSSSVVMVFFFDVMCLYVLYIRVPILVRASHQ